MDEKKADEIEVLDDEDEQALEEAWRSLEHEVDWDAEAAKFDIPPNPSLSDAEN